MIRPPLTLSLTCADASARFAAQLGARLAPGDCLLLSGPIGAGKTHICRHLIQSLLNHPEDVPSPTFTLVQTYDTRAGELWHADLYRLTGTGEVDELGLFEAFDNAICLVEWPDRLGGDAPADALTVALAADPGNDDSRIATLTWTAPKWAEKLDPFADD